jgi:hypothetical protein
LVNFSGCKLNENKERDTISIYKPKLFKQLLEQSFGKLIEDVRDYNTPAAPETTLFRLQPGDTLIETIQKKLYRSTIRMLLYLVKHSRPVINNAVSRLWSNISSFIKSRQKYGKDNKALKLKP